MNKIEILAPAGGMDSVIAAVRSGADAVYIGAKAFSARASAHNFDSDEMREAAAYCHERGVKVYLALNTIIFDDEMQSALDLAKDAARADIDAVIIQDMGLVSLLKRAVPDLPLHASTQMTVHTPYGAKALYELGFKRVVLSRELSLGEIKEIHDFCPEVELEVFVHGALCMCLSGQCYFSTMLGGRSANRGMCAQPCRLPISFGGTDHALSLKDNGSLEHIRELQEIGVKSAKIEGRMKRPEYVATAVAAAAEARDTGSVSYEKEQRLRAVFSRSGFTDGYLTGELGEDMFGYRRREDVVSADEKLLKKIRNEYKDERPSIKLEMTLTARAGEKPLLTVSDGGYSVRIQGETPAEKAVNPDAALIRSRSTANLKKTGGTQYEVAELYIDADDEATLPISALNALRREALMKLDGLRAKRHDYAINDFDIEGLLHDGAKKVEDRVYVALADYPKELEELGRVYTELSACEPDSDAPSGVEYPRATFGNEKEVYKKLRTLREKGAEHLNAHSIAAAYIGRELGYTVHGGLGLNIVNSWALRWAADYGIVDAELSPEIDIKRIEKLKKAIPVGIIRYGNLPLMITRNVPAGKNESCKNNEFLQDRKNEKFSLMRRDGYCEILNCVPILMPREDYELGEGVFSVFRFTVENSVEKMKNSMQKLRKNHGFERITHGLYIRGVKNFTI